MRIARDIWVAIAALIGVGVLIAGLRATQAFPNPTIAALLLLLIVLATATAAPMRVAVIVSVVTMLAYNFFLLPPFHTLTIADPQNWVALFVFLVVAISASQLSGALRQRSLESLSRQQDLERLYALSRSLLLAETEAGMPAKIARAVADVFEIPGAALYDHHTGQIHRGGAVERPMMDDQLREVARQGKTFQRDDTLITAVRLGRAPIGSLAIIGAPLTDTVLQSVTNLVAIALERARGEEEKARAEAARQSSELRAAVLDAAAHEFKTPLTSMKAAATALRTNTAKADSRSELIDVVNDDLVRMEALVNDTVQMLRIDSGDFTVNRQRQAAAGIIAPIVKDFSSRLDGHALKVDVPPGLEVDGDGALLQLALRQVVDNALKYSPSTSSIELLASRLPSGGTEIAVLNSGSHIPDHEQPRLTERFYRGHDARHVAGTGMGLAIVRQIVEAHGGTLSVSSSKQAGTRVALSLPSGDLHA